MKVGGASLDQGGALAPLDTIVFGDIKKRKTRRAQLFPTVKKDGGNSVQRQVFVGKPVEHHWLHPE